jgi:regulator of sigma E protease
LGMHMIALFGFSLDWVTDLQFWRSVGMVLFGLGFVIFVHELGHFLVAKACGVKCEKFYLGFDIFGLKLFKFRYGETEYGIGLLPLGGYVKMLGQEDNPAKAAAEIERAKLAQTSPESLSPEEAAAYDPRSYLAKSVPQRMAIISAGVIMNIIFAFVLATAAYLIGVKEPPCVVGTAVPGYPAWNAGLQPGDRVIKIADIDNPRFRDLRSTVILGSHDTGVPFVVKRVGVEEPLKLTLHPDRKGLAPMVGIAPSTTLKLSKVAVEPILPISEDPNGFLPGDIVEKVDGVAIQDPVELEKYLATHAGPAPIEVTVLRELKPATEAEKAVTEEKTIALPARPMLGLGLTMEFGPIVAVQEGSPAAAAGLKVGDLIKEIDGKPIGDPLNFGQRLDARVGQTVKLTVEREGKPEQIDVTVREPHEIDGLRGETMGADSIGVAYGVTNKIASVEPNSPAAEAGLKAGEEIDSALFLEPKELKIKVAGKEIPRKIPDEPLQFTKDDKGKTREAWPMLIASLQRLPPGAKVKLTLADGKDDKVVTLASVATPNEFNPDRGLQFEELRDLVKANSLSEAMRLGSKEAVSALTQVYSFLRALGTKQVSAKGMAGPVGILQMGYYSASEGISPLLMFLVMLSANLAVLNFLPIPLLDGGHMVLLIYEGLRGKPASEKIVIGVSYAGLLFILSLMGFLLLLDTGLIPRI